MASKSATDEKEHNILYELLILGEWTQGFDNGLQKVTTGSSASGISFYLNPWQFFSKSKLDGKKFLQTEYAWQLAVSNDGKVIGILQETLLEIRTVKDEYTSVVGKASVPCDQYPQLRKLSWSPDNSFLAVARDNGTVNIYNLLGCNIASIQPNKIDDNSLSAASIVQPVVGLLFLQPKFKSTKWSNELFVIYNSGEVRSILLSSLDGCDSEENANYSVQHYFPEGITSVAYLNLQHIFIIAGFSNSKEHGISVWRILNDYPYLKMAFGCEKSTYNTKSFLRFLPRYSVQISPNTVIQMKISPNGELLACLHYSGDISIWYLPGIHLYKRWPLVQQPDYNKANPQSVMENIKNNEYFYPVAISWWSDDALVIARKSGAVSVCSISTLNNLLGDSPEFLSHSPQISSIHGIRSAVIALECEVENNMKTRLSEDFQDSENDKETSVLQASLQAALYSFTDIERFEPKRKTPRITLHKYRLLALKQTTPEELYTRKIDLEDYDSALILAKNYTLDCDLVYQKQWRSSCVTKESIYNYLDKVNNIHWVVNECIERVPDSLNAAKELLKFGLKKTDFDGGLSLTKENEKMVSCRKQLLKFLDNLTLYEKIIENPAKYNGDEFDQFRRKTAVINTVTLARQENWVAVSIMFTYRGNCILEHRLPILSNFPETLPSMKYRSLLPEVIGNEVIAWEVKQLRCEDWSEDKSFGENDCDTSSEYIYESDPSLKRFKTDKLTPSLVEEWYKRRVYEIEKNTGLVEYALSFAKLGRERNIQNLDKLLFDLETLHYLVYVIQDQEITLSKLESLTHLEQAKLLFSKTNKSTFMNDIINVLFPFALRCERQGYNTFFCLLKGVLLSLSEENLDIALELFRYFKDHGVQPIRLSSIEIISLALDCLYICHESDQLDNSYFILECLPVRKISMTAEEEKLHDKLDKLEIHLEVCQILNRYKIYKQLQFVQQNEENKEVGLQLMQEMAKFTKNESLNFNELLQDLEKLQNSIFTCVDSTYSSELVAFTQLTCESEEIILSAKNLLQCEKNEENKIISYERSIQLVLKAAKYHSERAASYNDVSIILSIICLNLITESHPQVEEELDLINALSILGTYNVKLLPLQVRKCDNKMKLIEACIESEPEAYRCYSSLSHLAQTLRIYGSDQNKREGEVLMLMAQKALKVSDYQFCSEICRRLVSQNFSPAWSVVRDIAEINNDIDKIHKKEFLAFALLHCPAENLEDIIEARVKLSSCVLPEAAEELSGNFI